MTYRIENEFLVAEIAELGAELVSLKLKDDSCEYIWQGDEKYWTGHAPIMFPICGRLIDGKYTYRGKSYELGCHGFARHTNFSLVGAKNDEITLSIKSDDSTREIYPFDFIFTVTFSLVGKALNVKYSIFISNIFLKTHKNKKRFAIFAEYCRQMCLIFLKRCRQK